MQLPTLSPGKRFALPRPPGSADALLLAHLAERERAQHGVTAIVTADASDARRLLDEIAFFAPGLRCALFPDWETLPYDSFSPHQDLISERLATLWRISQRDRDTGADVVIVPATTALYRLAPPSFLAGYTFHFKVGQKLDEAKLRAQLALAGYANVGQVVSPGEYAVRGGLIDLFPMGSAVPYRVDLFDDQIDSLRAFDPDSQRSLYPVPEVRLLPGREFPMDEEARARFRSRWREMLEGDPTKSRVYKDMGQGVATAGIEYYLPLFFDATATVFDYLGEQATVVLHGELEPAFQRFWQDTRERFRLVQGDPERPALPPEALFLSAEQFYACAKAHAQLAIRPGVEDVAASALFQRLPELAVLRGAPEPLARLQAHVRSGVQRVLLLAESAGRRESLLDFLRAGGVHPPAFDSLDEFERAAGEALGIATAPLAEGFSWVERGIDFVTETELFSTPATARRRRKQEQVSDVESLIKDLSELGLGDPVVHSAHGIGRYRGLVNMDVGNQNPDGSPALQEFLHLEYAGGAVLYVPVSQLQLISRYSGVSPDEAPLHKLGSGQWEKAKRKAASQVRDSAAELLNIYARRAAREGHAFRYSAPDYEQFVADFGFEETADQNAAIHAVIQDMISPRPMDRLVCGDVGFGKTEVALRAAFIAVMGGLQVAVVVPTTLLSRQHFKTFSQRFAGLPVRVRQASRLVNAKELADTKKGLADGTVDIVVGTHALLGSSVSFRNLGLLIVDEEQHFGVKHKERLKELKGDVHVLTLSATPIPRTLQLALTGVRELSLITTPPVDRMAVRTFISPFDALAVREALLRERYRGGQSFYVCPRLADLADRKEFLEKFVPEVKVAIAHGQMPATELDDIMNAFYEGAYDVLLSTTIVESGLDIPTANTLIVHRADMFGLAQLYQLRGRVGRSKVRAFALFTLPVNKVLTTTAERRLKVLQSLDTLGAGFQLASHDLDIRGAGNLLGEEQSGHIKEVGFELYQQMLEEAVAEVKGVDEIQDTGWSPQISVGTPVMIPDDYVPDLHLRMALYRRLGEITEIKEIDGFGAEMIDRFGPMPIEVQHLLKIVYIKSLCRIANVEKLDAGPKGVVVQFRNKEFPNPANLVGYIAKQGTMAKISPDHSVFLTRDLPTPEKRLQGAAVVMTQLAELAK